MPKTLTPRVPSCAMCGATLRNKGWFCSYRCDVAELKQRFDVNKALFLSRMELAELLESEGYL